MNSDARDLEILSSEDCYRLLATQQIGRLGVNAEHYPLIFPVNYALDRDIIVLRMDPGTKLTAANHANVTFEVDEIDQRSRTGWSVLVRGPAGRGDQRAARRADRAHPGKRGAAVGARHPRTLDAPDPAWDHRTPNRARRIASRVRRQRLPVILLFELGTGFGGAAGRTQPGGTGNPARTSSPRLAALPPTDSVSPAARSASPRTPSATVSHAQRRELLGGPAGDLLFVPQAAHDVEALEDSAFLLTVTKLGDRRAHAAPL